MSPSHPIPPGRPVGDGAAVAELAAQPHLRAQAVRVHRLLEVAVGTVRAPAEVAEVAHELARAVLALRADPDLAVVARPGFVVVRAADGRGWTVAVVAAEVSELSLAVGRTLRRA